MNIDDLGEKMDAGFGKLHEAFTEHRVEDATIHAAHGERISTLERKAVTTGPIRIADLRTDSGPPTSRKNGETTISVKQAKVFGAILLVLLGVIEAVLRLR